MDNQNQQSNKLAAIISYITFIGWIIAFVIRDKNDAFTTLHLNQSLCLIIVEIIGGILQFIPFIGSIVYYIIQIAALVFGVWGLVRAIKGSSEPLPFIGEIKIL